MWSSNSFLTRCQKLHALGLLSDFDTGSLVARGYADLGFEEFVILHGGKLLSIFTGKLTELPSDHRSHFFRVPSVEELLDSVAERSSAVSLSFPDRRWCLKILHDGDKTERVFEGSNLADICVDALLEIISGGNP